MLLSGKTFLVTGATGRLGRDLVSRLEQLGARVLPLVLPGYPPRPNRVSWIARAEPVPVDRALALEDLPPPDYAIHLHWKVDRSQPFVEQIINELDWNVHRPAFLWNWLAETPGLRSFVNCSSIRVFSHMNRGPLGAATEPQPVTPYGLAKLAGEKFFSAYLSNTELTHLRLCSVCSHGEHPTHLMSQLAASAFRRRRIRLHAGRRAHILYIDEAVDLIINAALQARSGRPLAVAEPRLVEDLASTFERVSGRELDAEYLDAPVETVDPEYGSDLERLRAKWVRVTPLEQAMEKIIAHWKRGPGL